MKGLRLNTNFKFFDCFVGYIIKRTGHLQLRLQSLLQHFLGMQRYDFPWVKRSESIPERTSFEDGLTLMVWCSRTGMKAEAGRW
jgi:hypothetical protein